MIAAGLFICALALAPQNPPPPQISAEQQALAHDLRMQVQLAEKDKQIADLQGQVAQLRLTLLAADVLKGKPEGTTLKWADDGRLAIVAPPKADPPKKEQ
ncbi:MAG: hypothetical protein ACM3NQ_01330 [Bacteroidales bacterium]